MGNDDDTRAARLAWPPALSFVAEQRLRASLGESHPQHGLARHGAQANPGGYTLTFGTSSTLAVNPALGVKMPFEPHSDFVPIGMMVYVPYVLVANATLPGFDCNTWFGLWVPAGTSQQIVAKVDAELNRALADPRVIERLLAQGVELRLGTAKAFWDSVLAETERWRMGAQSAGLTASRVR